MTRERIEELRKTVRCGLCNTPGAMSECLDEIERIDNIVATQQKQIERLLEA